MRKLLAALLAAALLLPVAAIPAAAYSYTGNCANGVRANGKLFITKPQSELPSGYITEVYAEITIGSLDPCAGSGPRGEIFALVNIEGGCADCVIQLGVGQRTDTTRQFWFVPQDRGMVGYEARDFNWFDPVTGALKNLEAPELGNTYSFWIRQRVVGGNSQWRFEIKDITDNEKWVYDVARTWSTGDLAWWGAEWWNFEQDRPINNIRFDSIRYKYSGYTGWVWRQTNVIYQQESNGYCEFPACGTRYHHWRASTQPGREGYADNKLDIYFVP